MLKRLSVFIVALVLLAAVGQVYAQAVFPTVQLTSFNPVTFEYIYTVTCPSNSTYQFGYLQIDTQVANAAPTGPWIISGPFVGGVNKLWPLGSNRWDPAGKDSAYWDPYSRGTVIAANTYWQGVFKLTVPNSVPVSGGNAITKDGQVGSYKVHTVEVPMLYNPPPPQTYPPTTSIDLAGILGNNNWYISSVITTLMTTDPDNDVALSEYSLNGADWQIYSAPIETIDDGQFQLLARSEDLAGNLEDPPVEAQFKIDRTPPTVQGTIDAEANANEWYNSGLMINYTAVDQTSGLESPSVAEPGIQITFSHTITTEGANLSDSASAVDKAGNTGSWHVDNLKIDKTPPLVTGVINTSANASGWYNSDVVINYTAVDQLSGLEFPSVAEPGAQITFSHTINTEGINLSDTGSAIDKAGNTGVFSVGSIKIDKTAPTITVINAPTGGCHLINFETVTVDFTVSDATSGVNGIPTAIVNITPTDGWALPSTMTLTSTMVSAGVYRLSFVPQIPGVYTINIIAKDFAGNNAEQATAVTFGVGGFEVEWLPPISTMDIYIMTDGSTVPVKFRMTDPCNNDVYVNTYQYQVSVVNSAGAVMLSQLVPVQDPLTGQYHVNVKTKFDNGTKWPIGDYTVIISGPGIWDIDSGPYKSKYGLELVDNQAAKGKGKQS